VGRCHGDGDVRPPAVHAHRPQERRDHFQGLAKRNLYDSPMVRQARGPADYFATDIARVVKDYDIDLVIWPGIWVTKTALPAPAS